MVEFYKEELMSALAGNWWYFVCLIENKWKPIYIIDKLSYNNLKNIRFGRSGPVQWNVKYLIWDKNQILINKLCRIWNKGNCWLY